MGMFDTAYIPCPKCDKGHVSIQSKAGECILESYNVLYGVSPAIAADINGEWASCDECDYACRFVLPGVDPNMVVMQIRD